MHGPMSMLETVHVSRETAFLTVQALLSVGAIYLANRW